MRIFNGSLQNMYLAALACSMLVSCGSIESSFKNWEDARQSALEGLAGDSVPDQYVLKAVPALSTPVGYRLGSVFLEEQTRLRYSAACEFEDVNPAEPLRGLPSLETAKSFEISGGVPDILANVAGIDLELETALSRHSQLLFKYIPGTGQTVDIARLNDQLFTVDCIADIADKDIWVLAGIFNMKEEYASKSNLIFGSGLKTIGELGVDLAVDSNDQFVVRDSQFGPRAWAFVPVRIDVDNFEPSAPRDMRRDMARQFLGSMEGPRRERAISYPALDVNRLNEIPLS